MDEWDQWQYCFIFDMYENNPLRSFDSRDNLCGLPAIVSLVCQHLLSCRISHIGQLTIFFVPEMIRPFKTVMLCVRCRLRGTRCVDWPLGLGERIYSCHKKLHFWCVYFQVTRWNTLTIVRLLPFGFLTGSKPVLKNAVMKLRVHKRRRIC